MHQPLKCGWCTAQPIQHREELIHTHASHSEGSVLAGFL